MTIVKQERLIFLQPGYKIRALIKFNKRQIWASRGKKYSSYSFLSKS